MLVPVLPTLIQESGNVTFVVSRATALTKGTVERNVNGPGAAATFIAVHSKLIFDVDTFNQTFTVDVTEDDTEEAQMDFHASITVSPANDEGRCTISDGSVQFAVEASDDTIRLQPRLRHKVSNVNLASHPPACTMFSSLSAAKARLVWLMGRVNSAPSSFRFAVGYRGLLWCLDHTSSQWPRLWTRQNRAAAAS
jgi:hypothetical protein